MPPSYLIQQTGQLYIFRLFKWLERAETLLLKHNGKSSIAQKGCPDTSPY